MKMAIRNWDEIQVGSWCDNFYISLEDMQRAGVSDFKKINAIVKITTKDGEVLAQRSLVIEREAFE